MTGARRRPGPGSGAAAALVVAAAVGGVASCARQGAPPGGPPDRLSPEVVRTRPDTFARVEAVDGAVRIEFSERISEQPSTGTLREAVLVSPRTGEVRVSHGRDALEVDVAGGFRPGLVYRVTVLPVVEDLFGNALSEPFELVFSTGGEYHPNALAGLVVDRITGEPVERAEVRAVPEGPDTADVAYVSRSDASGIYTLRYLSPARYTIRGFQDLDRNREAGPFEAQGERTVLMGTADTLLGGPADLILLTPDTSAARLAEAALEDSVRVGLTFDDYLEPTASLADVEVDLEPVPDTTEEGVTMPPPQPGVARILHEREYRTWQDSVAEVRARADSVAAEELSARADSAAAAADSAAAVGDSAAMAAADSVARAVREEAARRAEGARRLAGPAGARGGGAGAGGAGAAPEALPDGTPLPARRLVLLLEEPVPPGAGYRVRVSGVVNVNGLDGGSGEATFRREAAPDTTGAPADTAGAAGAARLRP